MNRQQLFKRLQQIHAAELELIHKKNQDYGAEQDPFENFRLFGELGFLVRMSDKLMRIKHILGSGKVGVKDESVVDTLMDLSNYANLLMAYLEENEQITKN